MHTLMELFQNGEKGGHADVELEWGLYFRKDVVKEHVIATVSLVIVCKNECGGGVDTDVKRANTIYKRETRVRGGLDAM